MDQAICFFKTPFENHDQVVYGRSPLLETYKIPGDNDEPYADRTLICVLRGRVYQAVQVCNAVGLERVVIEIVDGSTRHGYRPLERDELQMSRETLAQWSEVCHTALAPVMNNILATCAALGYNVTADHTRVLNGLVSDELLAFPRSLPAVLMLVADSTSTLRFAIPSWDGRACVFRLEGSALGIDSSKLWMYAVDRRVREKATEEWLKIQGGTWRNGWLEDANSGERWYSAVVSTRPNDPLGIKGRFFDVSAGSEVDCVKDGSGCPHQQFRYCWSGVICITSRFAWLTSIAVSNASRLGMFFFEVPALTDLHSIDSISVVISNLSILLLRVKWFIAIVAAHRRFSSTESPRSIGIGCLANSLGFEILPLMLLPRLRNALPYFFSAGIIFEGDQASLSALWFRIYPGITEVVLFYLVCLTCSASSHADV